VSSIDGSASPAPAQAIAGAARPLRVALLGNPNCGKTALFNLLTGSRQKVANYAGVTVERKEGRVHLPGGRDAVVLDLPGTYSLHALSLDEQVTHDVVTGRHAGEPRPDLLVCVADATKLLLNLRLVLEARWLRIPMLVALNMTDMAERLGIRIDAARLSDLLGVPVVPTIGVRADGAAALVRALDAYRPPLIAHNAAALDNPQDVAQSLLTHGELNETVRGIVQQTVQAPAHPLARDDAIDRVLLHPLWGLPILAALLFFIFQAVFSWAEVPMDWIRHGMEQAAAFVGAHMAAGPLRSLLTDGVIAGVGSVLVFLPQILILFFFILALEDLGYLPRAAFLLDRVMGRVGLSGRSFIPLLSSFACAVPGIMATRTITHWRDRLVTMMIAPLMTCSARLPVYTLLIAAFIPKRTVAQWFNLQGLVLFVLYMAGILSALALALVWRLRGGRHARPTPLIMELPAYRWPSARQLAFGLWERARIFLQRVGGIILAVMVLLWFLSSYPAPPAGATQPAIMYSWAGQIGLALEKVLAPVGFNWQIAIALVPGMAAREVVVGALGTVYALEAGGGDGVARQLAPLLGHSWSLATALALLAWYVYAPQCVSTLVAIKREAGGWRYPLIMLAQLFGLAYLAAFITYRAAVALGAG